MPSLDVSVRIDRVKEALNDKGFEDINATHYDNSPNQLIVLHDDHGRLAHGEDAAILDFIERSSDVVGLWSALEAAGMIRVKTVARA